MNTTTRSIFLGAGVALVIIGGAFGWQYLSSRAPAPVVTEPVETSGETPEPYRVPPPGQDYTNEAYGFSLTLPQGFSARELEGVVVVADEQGRGVQVVVTPIATDIPNLTAEFIHGQLPDLEIRDPFELEIGEGRTGLVFLSDNQAFDGASLELWFAFNGHLYQLSTYEYLDPLLQAIFNSWEFL